MSFSYSTQDGTASMQCNLECRKCIGTTKTGAECARRTCKFLPYCFQHLRSELGLYVAESTIPNSGNGLFTLKDIKEDEKFAPYLGRLVSRSQIDDLYGSAESGGLGIYAFQLSKDKFIDAACVRGIGAFANAKPGHNNARISPDQRNQTAYLRATKNIKAGSEIFTTYGSAYFGVDYPNYTNSTRKVAYETPMPEPRPLQTTERTKRSDRKPPPEEKKSVPPRVHLKLEVRPAGNKGMGLFARSRIEKGEVIDCIADPVLMTEEQAEAAGFPHDSVLEFVILMPGYPRERVTIFDGQWTNPKHKPLWYYMNHMRPANAELFQVDVGGRVSLCWRARRTIAQDEEIGFDYDKNKRRITF